MPCALSCTCWLQTSCGYHSDGASRLRTWRWRVHVWWSRSDAEFLQYGKCHQAFFSLVCLVSLALAHLMPVVHVQWLELDLDRCWMV